MLPREEPAYGHSSLGTHRFCLLRRAKIAHFFHSAKIFSLLMYFSASLSSVSAKSVIFAHQKRYIKCKIRVTWVFTSSHSLCHASGVLLLSRAKFFLTLVYLLHRSCACDSPLPISPSCRSADARSRPTACATSCCSLHSD